MSQTWNDLKAFYDNVRLRQLTNINKPGAGAIDDVVGLRAEKVAISLYERIVGVTYDATNVDHENVLFSVIIYVLEFWGNKLGENWRDRKQAIYDELKDLQLVTARRRVTPVGSSQLDPTDDTRDGTVSNPKPEFDLSRFDQVTPNSPAGLSTPFPNPFPT